MRKLIAASLVIVVLTAGGVVSAFSQSNDVGEDRERHRTGCLDQLTEEQRETLIQMIHELKDAGATREEIEEAVQQFLEDLGIDTEECRGPLEEFRRRERERKESCLDQLTVEQRATLFQTVQELKDSGATREEITEAIQQFLEDLGIDTENCQVPTESDGKAGSDGKEGSKGNEGSKGKEGSKKGKNKN